jgi:hypothetical protein
VYAVCVERVVEIQRCVAPYRFLALLTSGHWRKTENLIQKVEQENRNTENKQGKREERCRKTTSAIKVRKKEMRDRETRRTD